MSSFLFQWILGLLGCGTFWWLLRHAGLMHFGLALYAATGAFASVLFLSATHSWIGIELQVALVPVVSAVVAWLLAAFMSRLIIRQSGLTFSMLSLAVAEMAYLLAPIWPHWTGGEAGWSISRGSMSHLEVALMAGFWLWMCVLAWHAWKRTPMALWAAVHRDREERLALWGVSGFDVRFQMHGVASAIMGLWGGLAALWLEHVSLQLLDPMLSAWFLLFGWLGGASVWGLLMGSFAWAVFRVWGGVWSDSLPLWLGLLFVVVMVWRSRSLTPSSAHQGQPWLGTGSALVGQMNDQSVSQASIQNSMPVVLQLQNVSVVMQGVVLLKPIDLALQQGQWLGIRGVNGAGKSTLLKAITGERAIEPGGRILFLGRDITQVSVIERARLGICRSYQSPALMNQMTVGEHVMVAIASKDQRPRWVTDVPAVHSGATCPRADLRSAWRTQALSWLQRVGLESYADASVHQLSYAQQRLLECVMTAAFSPILVLLDEPTAGLNPIERQSMAEIMKDLFVGSTCILVEHDADVLETLCVRVIEISSCSS